LVVDFQLGFTDPNRSPLAGDFSKEVENTAKVITVARKHGISIFFTFIQYESHLRDGGLWIKKVPSLQVLRRGSDLVRIDTRLSPGSEDVLISKKYASAFFGTALAATLTTLGIDTLIVAGCTTSGCVRASVVDAIQNGFRPLVLVDGVADRARGPHESNLFDMGCKYAELATTEQCLAYLQHLPKASRDRPSEQQK
jgi:nicotinamidase-related amidase